MQALWDEPWTACSIFVDENKVLTFWGDVTYLWQHAKQCTIEVKARPGREKTKWRCHPGFLLARFGVEDSIPHTGCFLSASEHILRTLSKNRANQRPLKLKAEFRTPIIDFLRVEYE